MASPYACFEGRVYAITGLAGMGLSIAKLLYQHGASVSLADVSQKSLDDAASTLGGDAERILTARVDVGDWAQVEAWTAQTVTRFGRLDGAANFAGAIGQHHGMTDLVDQDNTDWELIIRVNLTGMMHCVKAQLRAMKQLRQTAKETGRAAEAEAEAETASRSIVNASSIQGLKGFPKHVAYSTSKHGTIGLTRGAAMEVADDNIRINCIAPGNTATPLLEQSLEMMQKPLYMPHPIKRPGTSDEMAQMTLFLLSDAAQYITGSVFSVDGGWNCS